MIAIFKRLVYLVYEDTNLNEFQLIQYRKRGIVAKIGGTLYFINKLLELVNKQGNMITVGKSMMDLDRKGQ